MVHDFDKFPELSNAQMTDYYWESPHRQITENFTAYVWKVIDGDTVQVKWYGRNFPFKIRMSNIAASEMSEDGEESKNWLEKKVLGEEVLIKVDPNNRVGKWGRLLGEIIFQGVNINEESILMGMSVPWENRKDGKIINSIDMGDIEDASI